jgi:hypothetical protein
MRKSILFILCFSIFFNSFSNGKVIEKKCDYGQIFNQLICQLNVHPENQRTKKKIQETYSRAIEYYQREIDRILMSNNSLKWAKTLDVMLQINGLSEEIIYNSAVSELICDPKVYSTEIDDAKQRAVAELYNAGTRSLQTGTRSSAKEAYFCFVKAYQLSPTYKDVATKIQEAKNKAVLNVVVEKVAAYAENKNLISTRFYETFLNKFQSDFLNDGFINIYSFTEAKQRKIDPVDWSVRISFIDFEIGESSVFDNTTSVNIYGVTEIKIFSPIENKDILSKRIPGQYVWKSYQNNSGADLQSLFDSYSMSMYEQVFGWLEGFVKKSN